MTNEIRPLRNQRLKRPGDLRKGILRRHIALPTEHGAWIWWIGPLLIGAAAGEQRNADVAVLFLTALAAFLARHPLTLLVKVRSGRRSTRDLAPAAFWAGLYSFLASVGVILLLLKGHGRVLWLAVPGQSADNGPSNWPSAAYSHSLHRLPIGWRRGMGSWSPGFSGY